VRRCKCKSKSNLCRGLLYPHTIHTERVYTCASWRLPITITRPSQLTHEQPDHGQVAARGGRQQRHLQVLLLLMDHARLSHSRAVLQGREGTKARGAPMESERRKYRCRRRTQLSEN
jgi:hypothetical protein